MTPVPLASLIKTAQRFYPSGISPADERYTETPEYLRAREAWKSALQHAESWQRVLELLRSQAGSAYRVRDLTVPYMHPSWRVALLIEGTPFIAVGCVSVLAPIFFCYGLEGLEHDPEVVLHSYPAEVRTGLTVLERNIRAVFEHDPLSSEQASAIVPGVDLERSPTGRATLLAALISDDLNHYV